MIAYISAVFTGLLLCNSVPHLVAALQGKPFPSPFATPRGVGDSSPLVNMLWGAFNLFAALGLMMAYPIPFDLDPHFGAFAAGVMAIGLQLSLHFGKVMAQRELSSRAS